MFDTRKSFGFVCTDEDFNAVQRRPTPEEQVTIDEYRDAYNAAMGYQPHGFHYFPFPGEADTVCIWLPIEGRSVLDGAEETAG
jgi:hypothetical protein